jgi:tetratricopeptide (TPR) repeat protein
MAMSMKSEQQITKAHLFLKRKEFDRVIESLEKAIQFANEQEQENEDDDLHFSHLIQAHCFLGEVYFMKNEYVLAKKHFEFVQDNSEEIYQNWDDALNHELQSSELLLSLIADYT